MDLEKAAGANRAVRGHARRPLNPPRFRFSSGARRAQSKNALGQAYLDLLGAKRRAFDVALDDLGVYMEANADVAEMQSTHGSLLFGQGRTDEAEKAFGQAIALDPTLSGAHINLAESIAPAVTMRNPSRLTPRRSSRIRIGQIFAT
jgi:tetratricopeptide (TPR) repeat protein